MQLHFEINYQKISTLILQGHIFQYKMYNVCVIHIKYKTKDMQVKVIYMEALQTTVSMPSATFLQRPPLRVVLNARWSFTNGLNKYKDHDSNMGKCLGQDFHISPLQITSQVNLNYTWVSITIAGW